MNETEIDTPDEDPTERVPSRMPMPGAADGSSGSPLADYMTNVITEQYVPVVEDCTSGLLERNPGAIGELTLDTTISGTEELGGVVEDVGLAEGATFEDQEFVQCVQESLYALVLDASPEDQRSLSLVVPLSVKPQGDPE